MSVIDMKQSKVSGEDLPQYVVALSQLGEGAFILPVPG